MIETGSPLQYPRSRTEEKIRQAVSGMLMGSASRGGGCYTKSHLKTNNAIIRGREGGEGEGEEFGCGVGRKGTQTPCRGLGHGLRWHRLRTDHVGVTGGQPTFPNEAWVGLHWSVMLGLFSCTTEVGGRMPTPGNLYRGNGAGGSAALVATPATPHSRSYFDVPLIIGNQLPSTTL